MTNFSLTLLDEKDLLQIQFMSSLLKLYLAHKLTEKKSIDDPEKLNQSIQSANIDLNSHQVDAAIFAFKSPLSRGAILADEVGLGKTIEAGLIINQLWVEGRRYILILVPASLRTQWQEELYNRFNLQTIILDGPTFSKLQQTIKKSNPLQESGIYIASHNFAFRYEIFVKEIKWDLVVIDEAHRMRNVYKKGNKTAKKVREAIKGMPKILLTATPLQNNLMELFGLSSFLDENYLGTDFSYRTLFVNPVSKKKKMDHLIELKERLMGKIVDGECKGGIMTRTLRKQVREFVKFTNRYNITEDFAPNDNEMQLYDSVSEYLRRPFLASTRATQRNMMELVYRKILASSSFAIAGTLEKIVHFLSKRLQEEHGIKLEDLTHLLEDEQKKYEGIYKKQLPDILLNRFDKIGDVVQENLPGFDDLEFTSNQVSEEMEDSDDLGEEENENKLKKDSEINHVFTSDEIIKEFKDVLSYFYLASTIDINQKSQALVRALKKVFEHALKKGWPEKAVIFTESRRTQDHLEKLLSGVGFPLVMFNGTNASKRASEIYSEWMTQFPKEASNGSKSINIRKALVWKFKTMQTGLLITTEAGAEGLNLQFANIVINYDLPWNPQRIEQRIGRCHRYGQDLDVMVINFLNKKNYADQRVYELLSEKIRLFGNLFDFSDKVLGTEHLTDDGYEVREVALAGLGAGIDFEKKVLNIYRSCRTRDQIEKCFEQLQLELSDVIQEKIEETHKKIIQHFDEEVRQKLVLRNKKIEDALTKYDQWMKQYLQLAFTNEIQFTNSRIFKYRGNSYSIGKSGVSERENGILPISFTTDFVDNKIKKDKETRGKWKIILSHPVEKSRKYFEGYIGMQGELSLDLLTCKRKTINNDDEIFEKIILSALIDKKGLKEKLDPLLSEKLFELNLVNEIPYQENLSSEISFYSENVIQEEKKKITRSNENYVMQEMENLDKFAEESLLRNKQEMDSREQELRDLGKRLSGSSKTMGFHERQEILEERDTKQKELLKAQKKYFQMQEEQFRHKDKKIAELRGNLQMNYEHTKLAEAVFTIIE